MVLACPGCVFAELPRVFKVTFADQFDKKFGRKEVVTITKPMYFGVPVEKNAGQSINKNDHLACYFFKSEQDTFPPTKVLFKNQFTHDSLTVRKSFMLCVPSAKIKIEEIPGQE